MKIHNKYCYLACEDGTIKVVKIKKNKIDYIRNLPKIDSKCLSLDLEIVNNNVKYIYASYSDSSIRKWDV